MLKQLIFLSISIMTIVSETSYAAISERKPPTSSSENVLNQQLLKQIYDKTIMNKEGKNADYIPELATVNPNYYAIAIVTIDGKTFSVGDAEIPFAIESISKPFVYGLALQDNGVEFITNKIGLNATGRGFNSVLAIEEAKDHLQNPLVNAGAIQITSTIKGDTSAEKWKRVLDLLNSLSDGKVYLGDAVYQSEAATNQHNQAIAILLQSYNMMFGDPLDAVDRYTKACSVMITAKQLAIMGATLASHGINPISQKRIFSKEISQDIMSQMVVSGLYETSGAWWFKVGLPAKSGVGGGIMAIVPNKMAIVVFSPRLDEAGNSVRAQDAIAELVKQLKLHMLN